jgi:hypothetical protein
LVIPGSPSRSGLGLINYLRLLRKIGHSFLRKRGPNDIAGLFFILSSNRSHGECGVYLSNPVLALLPILCKFSINSFGMNELGEGEIVFCCS